MAKLPLRHLKSSRRPALSTRVISDPEADRTSEFRFFRAKAFRTGKIPKERTGHDGICPIASRMAITRRGRTTETNQEAAWGERTMYHTNRAGAWVPFAVLLSLLHAGACSRCWRRHGRARPEYDRS